MSNLIEVEINGTTYRGELEVVLNMVKEMYNKENRDEIK